MELVSKMLQFSNKDASNSCGINEKILRNFTKMAYRKSPQF